MSFFEEDIAELFDDEEHAVSCFFNGAPFSAIANQEFIDTELGVDEGERESTVLYTATEHVIQIHVGDAITVNDTRHYVIANQPDRTGISTLIVSDTSPDTL